MTKNRIFLLVVSLFIGGGALLAFAHSAPSTESLDADLATVKAQIAESEKGMSKYEGGLLRDFILLRSALLKDTQAMLEQKRTSLLRRISLHYSINGKETTPASEERLEQIKADIDKAESALAENEKKADQYSGGLIQAIALTAVETNRATIAQLNFSYYREKYGIAPPSLNGAEKAKKKETPLGKSVQDKDAF